jgi:hypothetical protein
VRIIVQFRLRVSPFSDLESRAIEWRGVTNRASATASTGEKSSATRMPRAGEGERAAG